MSSGYILGRADDVKSLADRLAACVEVEKLSETAGDEPGTLAHSLSDLEQSFRVFLDVHLSRLVASDTTPSEVLAVLLDIGEELRHIMYHIKDPKFFRYIWQENQPQGR